MPNNPIIDDYRRVIAASPIIEIPSLKRMKGRSIALLLTQPLSEFGYLPAADEYKMTIDIVSKLGASYQVVIKQHPSERIDKYAQLQQAEAGHSVNIISDPVPAEKVFRYLAPGDIVIGAASTALVTAKLFYGASVFMLGVHDMGQLSLRKQYQEVHHLMRLFLGDLVKDFEELKLN